MRPVQKERVERGIRTWKSVPSRPDATLPLRSTENCYRPNLNGVNAAVVLATTCDPFLRVVKAKPNPRQRQHAEEKLEEKSAVIYIMI